MSSSESLPNRYLPEEKISERELFEIWLGTDRKTGRKVVIKRPRANAQVNDVNLNDVLRDSYDASRFWKHPNVLAPLAGFERNGVFEAVFPYLVPERREPLTREIFRSSADQIIPQLFEAIEFIHLQGYVHCDLTPENVYVDIRDNKARLMVGDLDLLRPNGAKPKGKIVGTRPYIAPEILEDEIIVTRSDQYSLGLILAQLAGNDELLREKLADNFGLAESIIANLNFPPELKWLAPIISTLTQKHYQLRPFSLLRLLSDHRPDLVAKDSDKSLFWHDLRSSYRRGLHSVGGQRNSATAFLKIKPRIFGIPAELISLIDAKANASPRAAIRIVRTAILGSSFSRSGERWLLSLPFATAKKITALLKPQQDQPGKGTSAKKFFRHGLALARSGQPLAAALWLESALEPNSPHYLPQRSNAVSLQLAKLYRQAGFLTAAEEIYRALLQSSELSPRMRLTAYHGLIDPFQIKSLPAEQWRLLGAAYGLARKQRSDFWRMKAVDKMLWSRYRSGEIKRTHKLAIRVDRFAAGVTAPRSRCAAANTLAGLQRNLGNWRESEKSYRRALENLTEVNADAMYTVSGNLASLLTEYGDYRGAIELSQLPVRKGQVISDPRRMMQIDLTAMAACSFVGDIAAAEFLASRYSATAQMRGDAGALTWHALDLGRIYLRCGRLDEARDLLESASVYLSDAGNPKLHARATLFLSLLNTWRGNLAIARELHSKAAAAFVATSDQISILDARQVEFQFEMEIGGRIDIAKAAQLVADYLKIHNPLGALFTMSLILLEGDFQSVEIMLKGSTEAMNFARNSGAVIGHVVLQHLKGLKTAAKSKDAPDLAQMRESLIAYRKAGFLFHAARVADALASEYLRQNKAQLARGFLLEHLRLVTLIGNRARIKAARQRLDSLNESLSSLSAKYQAILEVSQLLNSFEDFDVAANNLVSFALEQTGAERAALLLATDNATDLRVESFIACDKVTLEDILTMSRSVMNSVFENKAPLIIGDAQTNDLTREYRSVIKHNIYSIACVPLVSGKDVIGVLYLDHHSLPSVFSEDEHKLITAVADFIAVVLAQARQFDISQRRTTELNAVHEALGIGEKFITRSRILIDLIEKLPRVADSKAPILLLGESGTGKEVLAKIIHQSSPYRDGALITLNCASYSGKVMETELFGIEKGIATGVDKRVGKIQLADGGSLFLDEIGELTLGMQAKLLRVLEEKEVSVIGGKMPKKVNFRLIAATNRNLKEMMEAGTFRQDLFYRISTLTIHISPLRERPEDLEPLVEYFMKKFVVGAIPQFTRSAWKRMTDYSWPGNVRELRNIIERLAILHSGGQIGENLLPAEIRASVPKPQLVPLRMHTDQNEKAVIARTLTELGWNQAKAARQLGLPYTTLQRKIKKYNIKSSASKVQKATDERALIVQTLAYCQGNLQKAADNLGLKLSTLTRKIKLLKIKKSSKAR